MTENKKRLAIVGGTILAAILILLFMRRGSASTSVVHSGTIDTPTLGDFVAGFNGNPGVPFIIPGLNLGGERDLSIIGACCSDCNSAPSYQDPYGYTGNTYVFNDPNPGNSIFNYNYAPSAPSGGGGLTGSYSLWH